MARGNTWAVVAAAVLAVGLVFLFVSLGVFTRGASLASVGFHVGCVGTACNGRDPGVELCGVEPQTLLHEQEPGGLGLEIRYNPLCRAAWARVWNAVSGDKLTLTVPGQPEQSVTVEIAGKSDPFVYTSLVDVPGHGPAMRACVTTSTGKVRSCFSTAQP